MEGAQGAVAACQGVGALPALYCSWTGDRSGTTKQAEQLAWRVENAIAAAAMPVGVRWGCEWDLAERFEVGLGVAREALAIMEMRGTCTTRKGPGGGIFVARPSTKMTAQAIANYLMRTGVTQRDRDDARCFALTAPTGRQTDAPLALLGECLTELDTRLSRNAGDGADEAISLGPWPERGDGGRGVYWGDYTGRPLSVAQRVGWAIASSAAGLRLGETQRLGSEEDLCCRFGVSRSSMRQAVRLLETFGIVESRPGRGQGLFASSPTPLPLIRRISSYLLWMRVPGPDCLAGDMLFAGAVLKRMAAGADGASPVLGEEISAIARSQTGERTGMARRALRAAMEQSPNPILNLFWRSMAGYTFRAFPAAESCSRALGPAVDGFILDTLEAVAAGEGESAAQSFHRLMPEGIADQWTILPQ